MKKFSIPQMAVSLPLAVLAAAILIFINELSFYQSTDAVASIEEAQQTRGAINKLLLQVARVAGQQIAALPGFRVQHLLQ